MEDFIIYYTHKIVLVNVITCVTTIEQFYFPQISFALLCSSAPHFTT